VKLAIRSRAGSRWIHRSELLSTELSTPSPTGRTISPAHPQTPGMYGPLDAVIAHNRGFFTRAQALECGWDDRELAAALRSGLVTRLRHGAYCLAELHATLDEESAHVLTARAVLHQQRGRVALTGISAAAVHGLVLWGQDLSVVHVVRLDGGSPRNENGVRHHAVGDDVAAEVEMVDGLPVVNLARSVWEVASTSVLEAGVCTADSALRLVPDLVEALARQAEEFRYRPGSRTARMTLRLMDGRSESAGESLSRVLFYRGGIPRPELQHSVRRTNGSTIGVSDFYWEDFRHLGEFDGKVKYGRFLRPGEQPGDAVFREKKREDEMRAEALGMTRWTYIDVMPQGQRGFLARLWAGLQQSASLYGSRRVVIV
jgi:hypothetical protein